MNPDKTIADFKQRTLHVDFLEMTLAQNKSGDGAIVYTGKGYLQQSEDDKLAFKLYAVTTHNTNLADSFNRFNTIKSGELYGDEAYYTLTARAADGEIWRAERVLPECDWAGWHENPVVHGALSSVTAGELLPEPPTVALHFFEKADLPVMIDEASFNAAGCEFRVNKDDTGFVVRAKSGTPLPQHFSMRVEEALRFLLAQSVSPRAVVLPRYLTLMTARPRSHRFALGPPISRGSDAFLRHSWALFARYLDFVIRETTQPYWNPCSGYLHNALEASTNSLDAWAIGLSVAVEGLANMLPVEADKEKTTALKALQRFIVDQVSGDERFKDAAPRIQGLVGGLTTVRAVDRMNWLASQGGADPGHIEAWKKLRNRGVHPTTRGDIDIASLDFQAMIDDLHRVNVLLYHIVFHLIGYRGPYTDYETRNFPAKTYPLADTPRATPAPVAKTRDEDGGP